MTDNPDGVALYSTAHPTPPWYRRAWHWLFGVNDISPDALTEVVINVPSAEDPEFEADTDPYLATEVRRALNGEGWQ